VGGDNVAKESVDSEKGDCVGPYFIVYVYLVSSYRPSHSPLSKSMHLVPLLLHHPLEVSECFRGTHNREETLEGDQEFYQLLLISKRPLLAMRPANDGGEGERLPCPVEVYVGGGREVDRGGDGGGRSGREECLKAGAAAALW
jgi:hypothetical protein